MRSHRRAIIFAPLAILSFTIASRAAADEQPTARLIYVANEPGCPDEASFRDQVAARLGYDPFTAEGKRAVAVEIGKSHGKLVARATLSGDAPAGGARELSGDRCEPLATALATTIAIALDPVRAMAPPPAPPSPPPPPIEAPPAPPPPAPPPPQEPPVPPPSVAPREEPSPPPPRAPLDVFASAGVVSSLAIAPSLTLGGDIGAGVQWKVLSIDVSGRAETTASETRLDSGDRVDATLFSAALTPCGHVGDFAGCAFVRLGSFQGHAPDVTKPAIVSTLFASVGLRAAYTLPFGKHFGLMGALEGGAPLVRTSMSIDGQTIWTAPPLYGGLAISGVARFL